MDTDFALRRATVDDAELISQQRHAMFTDMGHIGIEAATEKFTEWVRPKLANGDYLGWFVTRSNGEIVAGAGLWLIEWPPTPLDLHTRRGYILNVFVREEVRRHGLARWLVTTILDYCQSQGIRVILLHASEKGRALYDSLGFTATNEMRLIQPLPHSE